MVLRSLLEWDLLRGDPHILLLSTAAAEELRDGSCRPMVRKFVGLGGKDTVTGNCPRVGL